MRNIATLEWEKCGECGRKLKKNTANGQVGMIEPKRVCGNCVNRLKEQRLKPIIMEATGQTSLL